MLQTMNIKQFFEVHKRFPSQLELKQLRQATENEERDIVRAAATANGERPVRVKASTSPEAKAILASNGIIASSPFSSSSLSAFEAEAKVDYRSGLSLPSALGFAVSDVVELPDPASPASVRNHPTAKPAFQLAAADMGSRSSNKDNNSASNDSRTNKDNNSTSYDTVSHDSEACVIPSASTVAEDDAASNREEEAWSLDEEKKAESMDGDASVYTNDRSDKTVNLSNGNANKSDKTEGDFGRSEEFIKMWHKQMQREADLNMREDNIAKMEAKKEAELKAKDDAFVQLLEEVRLQHSKLIEDMQEKKAQELDQLHKRKLKELEDMQQEKFKQLLEMENDKIKELYVIETKKV